MKKVVIVMLVGLMLVGVAGCSKVWMSAEYQEITESSAVVVAELNERCQAGDPNACSDGLAEASKTLNLLVDAIHGKESE